MKNVSIICLKDTIPEEKIMKNWKKITAAVMIGSMCICGCSSGQNGTESQTDYTTGVPWLCSVMEGNVTEDTPANIKDDFIWWSIKMP